MKEIINNLKKELETIQVLVSSLEEKIASLEAESVINEIPEVEVSSEEYEELTENTSIKEEVVDELTARFFMKLHKAMGYDDPIDKMFATEDEERTFGCKVMSKYNLNYIGKADSISLSMKQFFNEGKEKPFLNINQININVYDKEGKLLTSRYISKDWFADMPELNKLGLYKQDKDHNPTVITLLV